VFITRPSMGRSTRLRFGPAACEQQSAAVTAQGKLFVLGNSYPHKLARGEFPHSKDAVVEGEFGVCVECLFSRSPGLAPYGTKPACAKRSR
jgi:hypothetical protein